MVIERLLPGAYHRLRRKTFATMAERLPITPLGVVTEFAAPRPEVLAIATGSDGNVWFTDFEQVGFIQP
jgi:hypothetical protein